MPTLDRALLEAMSQRYLLPILLFFAGALIVHLLSDRLVGRLTFKLPGRRSPQRSDRQKTLRALISNVISILAFIVAALLSLSLFVNADTLVWMVGLFSAAFGLGMRPFLSDYFTGIVMIFEDTFDVGEKVEFPLFPQPVEGVVEAVTLRVTRVRGINGELFTMPNGDIRLVRNFSRGSFSVTRVIVKVPKRELKTSLVRLEQMSEEAMTLLPNLLEPWKIVSETGEVDDKAEFTIVAKAKYGHGATLRTRIMALIDERLHCAEVRPFEQVPTVEAESYAPPNRARIADARFAASEDTPVRR